MRSNKKCPAEQASVLIATLFGDDHAVVAGIEIRSSTPVLCLCRALVAAGFDPAAPLEAYRRDVLCLRVRSLGEGALLEISAHGRGFRLRRERHASLRVRGPRLVGVRYRAA